MISEHPAGEPTLPLPNASISVYVVIAVVSVSPYPCGHATHDAVWVCARTPHGAVCVGVCAHLDDGAAEHDGEEVLNGVRDWRGASDHHAHAPAHDGAELHT